MLLLLAPSLASQLPQVSLAFANFWFGADTAGAGKPAPTGFIGVGEF
jgi:hypothetical protein